MIAATSSPIDDPGVVIPAEILGQWIDTWHSLSPRDKRRTAQYWIHLRDRLKDEKTRYLRTTGHISAVVATLYDMGWLPLTPVWWRDETGDEWRISHAHAGAFLAYVRDSLVNANWARAAKRSQAGLGLEDGVDWFGTTRLVKKLRKAKRPREERLLIHVMAGGAWPEMRRYCAGFVDTPTCRRCGQGPETLFHRYWGCPNNDVVRSSWVKRTQPCAGEAEDDVSWMACFWLRGLIPAKRTREHQGLSRDANFSPVSHTWRWGLEPPLGSGTFFVDGSGGQNSADPRLRRPSWAYAFYPLGQSPVSSAPAAVCGGMVGGTHVSSGRGEAIATNAAIADAGDAAIVVTDYLSAHRKATIRPRAHPTRCLLGDEWNALTASLNLCEAQGRPVVTVKVKSHGTEADVCSGRAPFPLLRGNAFADALANAFGEPHQVPPGAALAVRSITKKAQWVQLRMLAIELHIAHFPVAQARGGENPLPEAETQHRRAWKDSGALPGSFGAAVALQQLPGFLCQREP